MATPLWRNRALQIVVASVCAGVAGWYGPRLNAAGWHLLHPRGWVNYRGLHVLVPWPWTSDVDAIKAEQTVAPEGISLKETAATMVRRGPAQMVFITVISPDPGVTAEQQTAGWMSSFRTTHPGSKFDEKTPAPIPAGSECLSARKPGDDQDDDQDVVWTCISVKDGWVANFEGHSSEEPAFFRIVGALKP